MLGHMRRCVTYLNQTPVRKTLYACRVVEELYISNEVRCHSQCRWYSVSNNLDENKSSIQVHEDENEADPFLKNEIKKYHTGKRWLARIMGADPETFTQKDIDESLQYLLPSHLWATDARPQMKHPYDTFEKPKKVQFGDDGRPLSSAFYTGKPSFHELVFDIWSRMEILNNPESTDETHVQLQQTNVPASNDDQEIMQWMNKIEFEQFLHERMSDKNYDVIMFRIKKLATHERASEMKDFIAQFQVPVPTVGKEELKEVVVYENVARAMGYRKAAIAEVVIREGTGTITVNTKPLLEYFFLSNDREQIMFPLLVIDELDRFDIEAHVIGGGQSGKSGAIRLGISRAVAALCPEHFEALDNAGLLIRDYRQKERKKPGRKKARRAFQWVKR